MPFIDEKLKSIHPIAFDIHEHLMTLQSYGKQVSHITEFGVRTANSTWAFLSSRPKKMISYDIQRLKQVDEVEAAAREENIDFTFIEANDLEIEIEPTELLFIDTDHTYEQVTQELKLHSGKVSKYILFHDTTLGGPKEQNPVFIGVQDFLKNNAEWGIKEHFENNNGLLIIERIN